MMAVVSALLPAAVDALVGSELWLGAVLLGGWGVLLDAAVLLVG
jgi:hypothetical protein